MEKIERDYEKALVENISKEKFVSGIEETLDALQSGRVYSLITPWNLDTVVWMCKDGYLNPSEEKVKLICGESAEKIELKKIIIDLSVNYGAQLEFVRGEAEQRVLKEFGGLVGILRW